MAKKPTVLNDNYDDLLLTTGHFSILKEISAQREISTDQNDLPVGTREILMVKNHHIITASWKVSDADPRKLTQTVIVLTGVNSPSTHAENAYIYFEADDAKIQAPKYVASKKLIVIYQHIRNLDAVLEQLKQKNVYCWIGHFAGGHLYADIHTSQA